MGERPGKQRKGEETFEAFHGNKTGDFIEGLVKDHGNIILTNAVMYQEAKDEHFAYLQDEGLSDLRALILRYEPKRIIALGKVARQSVQIMEDGTMMKDVMTECYVFYLPHPSWILRFRKDVGMYEKTIQTLLKGNKFQTVE